MKVNKKIKLGAGFYGPIKYKGKPVISDEEAMKMHTIYYQHTYLNSGFMPGAKSTHACLYFGHWCWSNAIQNPRMALDYLINITGGKKR